MNEIKRRGWGLCFCLMGGKRTREEIGGGKEQSDKLRN